MKSKKLTILAILLMGCILGGSIWLYRVSNHPLSGMLEKEWLDPRFPEKVDTEDSIWQVLPFGYTLGPWPMQFRNEPIVTKLTYRKGPPKKFIQSITQLWLPVEAELTLLGPRTLKEGFNQNAWKQCFESRFTCNLQRDKILDYLEHKKDDGKISKVTWFDQLDINGPRGIHILWDYAKYQVDDFVLITENGIAQGFELKTVKSDVGNDARSLFYQTLGSLKVKEELSSSREWIQNKIKSVQLATIQKTSNSKAKLSKLIEIQNWLFSLLSVNPTDVTPFFHLAGVTHLLALDLIKLQTTYFENQESWILSAKPNLDVLLKYSQDFENPTISKQIEDLIQDVLLQQQKATSILKK
jgi:hypothetical protein